MIVLISMNPWYGYIWAANFNESFVLRCIMFIVIVSKYKRHPYNYYSCEEWDLVIEVYCFLSCFHLWCEVKALFEPLDLFHFCNWSSCIKSHDIHYTPGIVGSSWKLTVPLLQRCRGTVNFQGDSRSFENLKFDKYVLRCFTCEL